MISGARLEEPEETTDGRIKVISISKIRKITAIKKNWIENGTRAESIGSNPHSKGEGFSRSMLSFLASPKLAASITEGRMIAKLRIKNI
jgi:hypothetical protein